MFKKAISFFLTLTFLISAYFYFAGSGEKIFKSESVKTVIADSIRTENQLADLSEPMTETDIKETEGKSINKIHSVNLIIYLIYKITDKGIR